MARTVEEILKLSIGDLTFQLAVALARIEALEEEMAKLKATTPAARKSP